MIKLNDYVIVTKPPGPWESSGEDDADLEAYVGHVGVVVEYAPVGEDCGYLVRFPSHLGEATGQRWVEADALTLVSRPASPLCQSCLEG